MDSLKYYFKTKNVLLKYCHTSLFDFVSNQSDLLLFNYIELNGISGRNILSLMMHSAL